MSMDELDGTATAREAVGATGRRAKRVFESLGKRRKEQLDEFDDIAVGTRALLRQVGGEIAETDEKLSHFAAVVEPDTVPAPILMPTPSVVQTPASVAPVQTVMVVQTPVPAPPVQAPPVDTTPTPPQAPKDEAPKAKSDKVSWWDKPLQHIRRWKWLAWTFAIIALLLSIPFNRWLDDLARWMLNQETGAAVEAFTVIFKITWSLFWFCVGGWFGEWLERKLDTTSDT